MRSLDDDGFRTARSRLAFVATLALALFLRSYQLQGQSLSSDEIIEASIARLSWSEIVAYPDGFPPLYHLLLAAWTKFIPAPESGRWLSVVFGVATVFAVGRWASRIVGSRAGVVAAILAAVSPLHIYLSQEMRAYSLYICLATFAMMFFFEALCTNRTQSWIAFCISISLAIGTHYYAAPLAGLLGVLLLAYRPRWEEMRRGLAAFVAVAICSAPAQMLLPGDVAYQSEGFAAKAPLPATLGHTAYAFFAGYSLGPSLGELHVASLREAVATAAPWVVAFALAGGWLLWQGWRELRSQPCGLGIVFLAVASAPFIGAAGELAGVGPKVRYWSWILMPLLVWLAAGAARGWHSRSRWITRLACAALICPQLFAVVSRHHDRRYANEDVRSAAAFLQIAAERQAPVFVVADYMAPPVRYYLHGASALDGWLPHARPASRASDEPGRESSTADAWIIHPRREADVRGSEPFDGAEIDEWLLTVRSLAGDSGKFWLLYTREFHGDRDGSLLRHLEGAGIVQLDREFPGVRVYRGELLPSLEGRGRGRD
jgi:mannosyltransferase